MRLFLSSDELGSPADHGQMNQALADLAGPVSRIAIVANGRDGEPPKRRRERVAAETHSLEPLGAEMVELDLRDHADRPDELRRALSDIDLVWITGGDMNVLRACMCSSGLDSALRRRLA
jgi:peptidase E